MDVHSLPFSSIGVVALLVIAAAGCTRAVYLADVVDGGQRPETLDCGGRKIYVFSPPGLAPGERRAAVVCIHGGGWTSGTPQFFFPHCRYFASRGAVAFSIQYRLADEKRSNLADCWADARAALRFIRGHAERFGIDPDRIAVVGDSAGGHLAACLGTIPDPAKGVSSRPNAMLLYNPVLDLTSLDWTAKLPNAADLSPMLHVAPGDPPTLLMHGTEDKSVPVEQARRFAAAMAKAGNRCDLVILDGIAHAFVLAGYTAPESVVVEAIRAGDRFLASLGYLDGKPTLRFRKGHPAKTKLFDIQ